MGKKYVLPSSKVSLVAAALIMMLSCEGCGWKGPTELIPAMKPGAAPALAAEEELSSELVPAPVLAESPGVVTMSRYHSLLAHTKGRIKRIFFEPGQYVRKGHILVKGYNHNYVVAPVNGFVAEKLIDGSTYLTYNTVVASLLELEPFQMQLMPPSAYTQPVAPGWEARLSRWEDKSFAASGVVLGSHLSTDGTLVVDLRLRSLAGGNLTEGTKIRAVLAPPQVAVRSKSLRP